jgi:hypothetical protein
MFQSWLTIFRCIHVKSQIYYAFAEYIVQNGSFLVSIVKSFQICVVKYEIYSS